MNKPTNMRVIFVGIHNKPGVTPLASSTKTGKIIDQIIQRLNGFSCVKSNLFAFDYLPENDHEDWKFIVDWSKRVSYTDSDIIVCLGKRVSGAILKMIPQAVACEHPSHAFAFQQYINNVTATIELTVKAIQLHMSKLNKHRDDKGKLRECECPHYCGSYTDSADNIYLQTEKWEMIDNNLTWDFTFDFCAGCDGIIGIMG